jgi:tRNA A37 threonylcarbamoyltransferase TsaD
VKIDRLAATGNPRAVALPRALAGRDDLDFSFSGLKTAVSTIIAERKRAAKRVSEGELRSRELVAGGTGPSQGPELVTGEGELRSRELVAGGTGPSQGPELVTGEGELRSRELVAGGTGPFDGPELNDFCASFQTAVVDVLVRKSRRALVREGLGALVVCGGVAANRGLRAALAEAAREDGFALYIPPPKRCTDNASMIAAAGTQLFTRGVRAGLDLAVDPGLPL